MQRDLPGAIRLEELGLARAKAVCAYLRATA
jgi:hypothetical protein